MSHVHNALHRCTEVLQGINRSLGNDRGGTGVERLGETLTPIMNPWQLPEWAWLRGELLGWTDQTIAGGGAGFRAIAQLYNQTENRLLVIEPGSRFVVAAGTVVLGVTATQATTDSGFNLLLRDTRISNPSVIGGRARSQNGVAIPAGFTAGISFLSGTTTYDLLFPLVVSPGFGAFACSTADDTQITASWIARVRDMLPGEQRG